MTPPSSLGAVEYQRIFEVLEDIVRARPGVRLLELDPGPEPGESKTIREWGVEELLQAAEREFRNMTRAARDEFEARRYWWGYLPDGRIAVSVMLPGGQGTYTEFIEAP